ncbi:hypothetical protein [Agromyces sp. Soil535]|uniref:hypothetical protein n=1 Tax=Agromyces sp. Soil535 TaxID=1736390 RepID=UPI000AD12EB5|nr:hypothetical protein [Agromyces sp. Soil535]
MIDSDWSLGAQVHLKEDPVASWSLETLRSLSSEEYEAFANAGALAAAFDGSRITLGITTSLNALSDALREQRSQVSVGRVGSAVTAWLAEFRAMRSKVESAVALVERTGQGSRTYARFDALYREDRDYRLAWELRNLDQHQGGASHYLTYTVSRDAQEWTWDLDRLFDAHERDPAWRACRDLWDGFPSAGVMDTSRRAFHACTMTFAHVVHEHESAIEAAVDRLGSLFAEPLAEYGSCAPVVFRALPSTDNTSLRIQLSQISPTTLGGLVLTVKAARELRGL